MTTEPMDIVDVLDHMGTVGKNAARLIRELREDKKRNEAFIEEICYMIPEEYDSDIAVQGVIMKWIQDIVKERDNLRKVTREVAENVMTPRQCREPLLAALSELGDDGEAESVCPACNLPFDDHSDSQIQSCAAAHGVAGA